MKTLIPSILLWLALGVIGFCQPEETVIEEKNYLFSYGYPEGAYLPTGKYAIAPNYSTLNPLWVIETIEDEPRNAKRDNEDFKADRRIPFQYRVDKSHYKGGRYDIGHLIPAADMMASEEDLESTFLFSNACPQLPGFNRGVWKRLEEHVRELSKHNKKIWAITLPLYEAEYTPKMNGVHIPSHFAKSLLLKNKYGDISMKNWIIPHASSKEPLDVFVVSVDTIEARSQLNLWNGLEDKEENLLESMK